MKTGTPFGQRNFNPPASHEDWGGIGDINESNQSEMTPTKEQPKAQPKAQGGMSAKEFFKNWIGAKEKHSKLSVSIVIENLSQHKIQEASIYEMLDAYANHVEAANEAETDDIQCECGRMADREFYDTHGSCEFCYEVRNEVERLEAAAWVSVDERLPEDGDEVLCCRRDTMEVAEYYDHIFMVDGDNDRTINATHWMPLPTPPKQ